MPGPGFGRSFPFRTNLGSQPPGTSTDVTFKEAGDVQVLCAIHPRMKLTVKVSE